MCICHISDSLYVLSTGFRASDSNILVNRASEQHRLLAYHTCNKNSNHKIMKTR